MFGLLWDKSIPLKVSAFCWRAVLDRIPSASNMSYRGIQLQPIQITCCFCRNYEETTAHLLLHCIFSYNVWMYLYNWLGLVTVLAGNIPNQLLHHAGLVRGKFANKGWRLIWFATVWSLWLHRNEMIFNNDKLDFDKVVELIKVTVWL